MLCSHSLQIYTSHSILRLWMVIVCCQRGRRGVVWEKGWEKEGDVQSQCTIGHTSLCVCIGIFVRNTIFVKTIYKPIQLWKIITMKHLSWRFWRLQWSKASQHQPLIPLIMKRGGCCKTYLNE